MASPQSLSGSPVAEFDQLHTYFGSTERKWIIDRMFEGWDASRILSFFGPSTRPLAARCLVQQGEALRSEFRSQEEAEAFWAHVGEDAGIERIYDFGLTPDPGNLGH